MAVTIQTDMTLISNCEATTGWSAGATNDSFQMEGTYCLGLKVSNNTSPVYSYTLSSAVDFTGKFAVMTMMITGKADTIANGGYRVYFEDSSGNNKTFYVGGNDTHSGGWGYFPADPSQTAEVSSGTLDITNILKIGVQMKTITNAIGNTPNIFWDICHYGSYIGATSLTTDTVTMGDLASNSQTNYYGLIQEIDGVYFCRGKIILGQSATTHINFDDTGSAIVWISDVKIPDTAAGIEVLSSSTTTSDVKFSNGVIKGFVTKPSIDASDVDVDSFNLDTMLVQNMDAIDLEDNSTISGCILDGCEQIELTDGTIESTAISSTLADRFLLEGSVNVSDSAAAAFVTDASFSTYSTSSISTSRYAVVVPATVTSFTMDNWQFDDPNNTNDYALYWKGMSGSLTISATNGTNLTTSGCIAQEAGITEDDHDPFSDSSNIATYLFENDGTDESTNYDLTATNITYGTGNFGTYSSVFNGDTSYYTTTMTNLGRSDLRSFSFWLKPLAGDVTQMIFNIGHEPYDLYYDPWLRIELSSSKVRFGYYGNGVRGSGITGANTLELGVWSHVVCVLSGVANTATGFRLFINGIEDTTAAVAGANDHTPTTYGVHIGIIESLTSTFAYKGDMDNFRIFNKALDEDEVWDLYTEGQVASTGTITISQDVTVQITSVIIGSSVYVATVDGNGDESTVLINEVAATTTVSTSTNYAALDYTNVIIKIRNSSGTTKYLPYRANGVISGTGLSVAANQLEDTIAT